MRYGTKVRLGNWAEDESARDLAAKDYEARRSRGELLHLRKAREKAFQTQPVPHTFSRDGLVRYGDHIQLHIAFEGSSGGGKGPAAAAGAASAHALSCSIFEEAAPGLIRVTASSAGAGVPQARNVFVLEPAAGLGSSADGGRRSGAPLRFGDRISLACNPALTVDLTTKVVGLQYLLHSQRANNIIGAGRRGRQEADMSVRRGPDTEWILTCPSGDALASVGEEVRVGAPVLLVHAMSGQALAADPGLACETDLGSELDVHLQTYRATAHASMTHTGELPLARAMPQNCWSFAASADPEAGVDARGYRALTPDTLLERARAMISAASGIHGLRSLALALSALDQRGTGLLPTSAVRLALFEHGATQSEEEFALMLGPLEEGSAGGGGSGSGGGVFGGRASASGSLSATGGGGGGGFIAIRRLLPALRGDTYGSGRREATAAAYNHLVRQKAAGRLPVHSYAAGAAAVATGASSARDGGMAASARSGASGSVSGPSPSFSSSALTIADVKGAFDAKFDCRVTVAPPEMTAVEAAAEFARQWPNHPRPGDAVSAEDWQAYYADVSALLPDDFEFVAMVANLWHVPGRGSWRAKASKRVLVTFHKGTSTEVVLPEAEDIADEDFEGLAGALKALGFGGIARVKVLEMLPVE